jgi:hypothetical protein
MSESEDRINFELHVRPETRSQSWLATLQRQSSGKLERLEFRSPLELARHLANLQPHEGKKV